MKNEDKDDLGTTLFHVAKIIHDNNATNAEAILLLDNLRDRLTATEEPQGPLEESEMSGRGKYLVVSKDVAGSRDVVCYFTSCTTPPTRRMMEMAYEMYKIIKDHQASLPCEIEAAHILGYIYGGKDKP